MVKESSSNRKGRMRVLENCSTELRKLGAKRRNWMTIVQSILLIDRNEVMEDGLAAGSHAATNRA
jgi:hypothetical protein